MKFAVIDVETTGLNPVSESVIEIGIIIIHESRVISEYSWLINPGKVIPAFITRLTGISNEMIYKQPLFAEVGPLINELLKDHILVGHNILFDYSFLKNEMNRCEISFSRKTLCTKEFSQLMLPGKQSYSLKSICNIFAIKNISPHRALSDARATGEIFIRYYLEKGDAFIKGLFEKHNSSRLIPEHLLRTVNAKLPSTTGVYYFIGKSNKPIYIGKAANIRQRVLSHFRGDGNSLKILALAASVKEIRFTETGNELIALLLEDHEIRHYWPPGNHAQKQRINRFGVVTFPDRLGRWRMAVSKGAKSTCSSISFHQYHLATAYISEMVKKYNLIPNLCGMPANSAIDLETHNRNFKSMLDAKKSQSILTEIYFFEGRNKKERSYILLENGFYKGYGFIDNDKTEDHDELYRNLKFRYSSITTDNILKHTVHNLIPAMSFQKDTYDVNFDLQIPVPHTFQFSFQLLEDRKNQMGR